MKLTKGIKFEDDPEYKKIEDVRVGTYPSYLRTQGR